MARYVLDPSYGLRGWVGLPFALWNNKENRAVFVSKKQYLLLASCDGLTDVDEAALPDRERTYLQSLESDGVVRACDEPCALRPNQMHRMFPCRYKSEVHWSITGRCNYRCKHCLVSAPHAKFGHPTTAQLLDLVEQMSECGIGHVSLTGGEPLIRKDFWQIVDALKERGIHISTIFSNGLLVNEALLDGLEARGLKPSFQLSHDGVGWHDWLRGFEGAEEAVVRALKLLQERGYEVDAAMALHRQNAHTLRETVLFLASMGVKGLKVNRIQELGEWKSRAADVALTEDESLDVYLEYIPQYFADGAPLNIILDGAFGYNRGEGIFFGYERRCETDPESEQRLSCGILKKSMYIGPDGRVCPCMSMTVQEQDDAFPSVFEQPLREILGYTPFMKRCSCTVGEVRDANPECRDCAWVQKCHGGCRAEAYNEGGGYYSTDPGQCHFFKNGWYDRFYEVGTKALETMRQ